MNFTIMPELLEMGSSGEYRWSPDFLATMRAEPNDTLIGAAIDSVLAFFPLTIPSR